MTSESEAAKAWALAEARDEMGADDCLACGDPSCPNKIQSGAPTARNMAGCPRLPVSPQSLARSGRALARTWIAEARRSTGAQ